MHFLTWFTKSLYQLKIIAYSRLRPITSTIWHILFLTFIASIPYLLSISIFIFSVVNDLEQSLHNDLPSFIIVDGVLQMDSSEVYILNQNSDIGFLLFDPTNSYTNEDLLVLGTGITFGEDQLLYVKNEQIQSIPYTLLGIEQLTTAEIIERINQLQGFLPLLLGIITLALYIALAGFAFLGITIIAIFSLLLRSGRSLEYRHLWNIAAHAITLPTILYYWVDVLLLSLPSMVYFIACLLVIYFSIRTIPNRKKKESS